MSRKVESRKWDFGLIWALKGCTECNPVMTSRIVYFPLKWRNHLDIIQPESFNMLIVLLLCQPLLNCSSSFIFLCYDQSNVSRRDITNVTAISKSHQNKYQYMELASNQWNLKQSLLNVPDSDWYSTAQKPGKINSGCKYHGLLFIFNITSEVYNSWGLWCTTKIT